MNRRLLDRAEHRSGALLRYLAIVLPALIVSTAVRGDDQYEPNNHYWEAVPISFGTYDLESMDQDWFSIRLDEPTNLVARATVPRGAATNVSLGLGQAAPSAPGGYRIIARSANGAFLAETIEVQVEAGVYFLVVDPAELDSTGPYRLIVGVNPDDAWEPNDTLQDAADLDPGEYELRGLNVDFFRVVASADGRMEIEIDGEEGNLDLAIGSRTLQYANSSGLDSHEFLEWDVTAGEELFVKVTPVLPCPDYVLAIRLLATEPVDDDDFEPNDTEADARIVADGEHQLVGRSPDWFRYVPAENGTLTVRTTGEGGDLVLRLLNADGSQQLASSDAVGLPNEIVDFQPAAGEEVLIHVEPKAGLPCPAYTLHVDLEAEQDLPEDTDQFEPNDDPDHLAWIEPGNYHLMGLSSDWFALPVSYGRPLIVTIDGAEGDLDLTLRDPVTDDVVGESITAGTSQEMVRLEMPEGGLVVILVEPRNGLTCPTYELRISDQNDEETLCGDGICEGDEPQTCPVDCDTNAVCGNGVCEDGEDVQSCPQDCDELPVCGNGVCEVSKGEDPQNCPQDCDTNAICGNGVCEDGEDAESCLQDCGDPPVCGDDVCEWNKGEDRWTCPEDCVYLPPYCGDGLCEEPKGETAQSCPQDCDDPPVCGDGNCESLKGEDPQTCPLDCGSNAFCGNGDCEAGEDAVSCPQDCDGAIDDEFEPNDTKEEAETIVAGEYDLHGLNDDWFHIHVARRAELHVAVAGVEGNLDLVVHLPDGTTVHSAGPTSDERVEETGVLGDVYLHVSPGDGAVRDYMLEVSVIDEECDGGLCGAGCGVALIIGFLGLAPMRRYRRAMTA
jgi:hypothetical protein